jgi:hypothetical protein
MLLGNFQQLNANPGRAIGTVPNLYSNYKPGGWYSFYDPDTRITRINSRACIPTGTQPHYSWILAPKGGEFSSTTLVSGTGTMTAALLSVKSMAAALAGSGSITANFALLSRLTSALAGSGTLTANLRLASSLAANLSGTGALSASLGLIIPLVTLMAGSGSITANLTGRARLEAHIYVNSGAATTAEIAAAVWDELLSNHTIVGSAGAALAAAGTAGDPWTTDLSGYNTAGTAGKIVKQIKSIGQANL